MRRSAYAPAIIETSCGPYFSLVLKRSPFIIPSAPVLKRQPPQGRKWLHEVKFDGWRAQLHKARRSLGAHADSATSPLRAPADFNVPALKAATSKSSGRASLIHVILHRHMADY
jgi:hypothetical protein